MNRVGFRRCAGGCKGQAEGRSAAVGFLPLLVMVNPTNHAAVKESGNQEKLPNLAGEK